MEVRNNTESYGPPGSAIDGSALVRAYCSRCGDPMRVSKESWNNYKSGGAPFLSCCRNKPSYGAGKPTGPRYRVGEEASPGQDNAIRHMEGD